MSRPRLLLVLHQWYNRGGTELHAQGLARGLSKEYDITVVFPDDRALVVVREDREIGRLPADPFLWPATPVHAPTTAMSVARLLASLRPDLIHIHHIFKWPLGTIEQLLRSGSRVLLSIHDYYYLTPDFTMRHVADEEDLAGSDYSRRLFGGDISSYLTQRREYLRGVLSSLPLILCPSAYVQRVMQKHFGGNYRVVEHGIEPFEVRPKVAAPEVVRFGYLGSFIPQKGFDVLLGAFQRIEKHCPEARLVMCGWGPAFDPTQYPGVHFTGPYETTSLPSLLAHIDVGIIPSVFRETYSLVLSEFWHAGVPVLASSIGALAERVGAITPELLVTPGSDEALAAAMSQLVEDQSWRNISLPRPRHHAEMLADYQQIYRELL